MNVEADVTIVYTEASLMEKKKENDLKRLKLYSLITWTLCIKEKSLNCQRKPNSLKNSSTRNIVRARKIRNFQIPFECCRYFLLFLSHNILIDDDWDFYHILVILLAYTHSDKQPYRHWHIIEANSHVKVLIRKWIKIKKVPHCTYPTCYHHERDGNDPWRLLKHVNQCISLWSSRIYNCLWLRSWQVSR